MHNAGGWQNANVRPSPPVPSVNANGPARPFRAVPPAPFKRVMVAAYAFEPQDSDELRVRMGERVTLKESYDDGMYAAFC